MNEENTELKEQNPQAINLSESNALSGAYNKKEIDEKFNYITILITTVVIILLVMVMTLLIDSFHFNSAVYKEYSQKTESVSETQKVNQNLLDQAQKNQQLILEQQKEILNFLKK